MQKIVFTGGEGVGKSSLLLFLETQGEHVIKEAASDILMLYRAMENPFPTDRGDFEQLVLQEHLRREDSIQKTENVKRVFIDRGWIDHIVYAKLYNWKLNKATVEYAQKITYQKIFFFVESDSFGIAHMNEKEIISSRLIGNEVIKLYNESGYQPILVEPDTIKNRAKFILNHLK